MNSYNNARRGPPLRWRITGCLMDSRVYLPVSLAYSSSGARLAVFTEYYPPPRVDHIFSQNDRGYIGLLRHNGFQPTYTNSFRPTSIFRATSQQMLPPRCFFGSETVNEFKNSRAVHSALFGAGKSQWFLGRAADVFSSRVLSPHRTLDRTRGTPTPTSRRHAVPSNIRSWTISRMSLQAHLSHSGSAGSMTTSLTLIFRGSADL